MLQERGAARVRGLRVDLAQDGLVSWLSLVHLKLHLGGAVRLGNARLRLLAGCRLPRLCEVWRYYVAFIILVLLSQRFLREHRGNCLLEFKIQLGA